MAPADLFTPEQGHHRKPALSRPDENEHLQERKRKRDAVESSGRYNEEGLTPPPSLEGNTSCKRPRQQQQQEQQGQQEQQQEQQQEEQQIGDPIGYWASHNLWPPGFANMADRQSDASVKKRRSSSGQSYSSRYRSGEVPLAHTAAFEAQLLLHGISLDWDAGFQNISDADRKLCDTMLTKSHEYTPSPPFPMSKLSHILHHRLSVRNEDRLTRDLTPLVVPSPENLNFSDVIKAPTILEDVGAFWKRIKTMGGPMPKPDLTVGIGESAFDSDELAKLRNYWSWDHATLFTDWVYFPFLICEVKCSDVALTRGARQAGHSGGMAANAVFQLCRKAGYEKAKALHQRILAFSIVHDHRSAEIYGVFPFVEGPDERPVFYRYLIKAVLFGQTPQTDIKQIRDFVIETYVSWYPEHLERVKDALKEMSKPTELPAAQPPDMGSMGPPTASANQLLHDRNEELTAQTRQLHDQNEELTAQTRQLHDQNKELTVQTRQLQEQIQEINRRLMTQADESERKRKEQDDELERKRKEQDDELERKREAEREQAEARHKAQIAMLEQLITMAGSK